MHCQAVYGNEQEAIEQAAYTCHTVFSGFDLQSWPTWLIILKLIKFTSIRVCQLGQSHIFCGRKTDYKHSHLCSNCQNKTFHSGQAGEGKNELTFILKIKSQFEGKTDTLMNNKGNSFVIDSCFVSSCVLHYVLP